MSSEASCKFCTANGKRNYCEEEERHRKSTERPRTFLLLAWCSVLIVFAVLCAKIVCLSSEVEEQRLQIEQNGNLLNELLRWRHQVKDDNDWVKPEAAESTSKKDDANGTDLEESLSRNATGGRYKRSVSRTRRRARFPTTCHLEGRSGPNIISHAGVPRQQPRTARECILWRRADNEPPAYCLMKTRGDEDGIGVQYIRVDKPGFYYVYAQLTYESHIRSGTGFRVERDRRGTGSIDILLSTTAPPTDATNSQSASRNADVRREESQYTGGVFYLESDDLIAVYPQRPASRFIMSQSRSFFGVHYVGRYDI